MPRYLLLSAYHAQSHGRWSASVQRMVPGDWTVLTLAPRHFSWRFRSNPMSFLGQADRLEGPWDHVLATSMVDIATLRGLLPELASAPTTTYFHENQFAYPVRGRRWDAGWGLLNLYSALASDRVLFNSEFNLSSMMRGASEFLENVPDGVPEGLVERIAARSEVLPVPLDERWFAPRRERSGPLQVVWNHRWEYDKAPERLFEGVRLAVSRGAKLELHVVGQQFRRIPDAFTKGRQALGSVIKTWGYVESSEAYRELLRGCDVALSTALHEFQGLAVQEAVALGCRPLVPNRVAYVERFGEAYRYASHVEDAEAEAKALADALCILAADVDGVRAAAPLDLRALTEDTLGPRYRAILGAEPNKGG